MDFASLVDDVLAGYFALHPVQATEIGNHDHDGEWPDLTDAGRAARRAWLADAISRLESVDTDALSRDQAIDRRILLANMEAMRFGQETLREATWTPLSYVYLLGGGLFALLAREFAPLPDRLRSVAARLRGIPVQRETLRAGGPRPASHFHTEKAAERMAGITDLAETAVRESEKVADAALRAEVADAARTAREAVDAFS